jgi:hypothetical protein
MAYFSRINQHIDTTFFTPGVKQGGWMPVWWQYVRDMIDAGWRVMGSGDTFSFENAGQTAGSGTGYGGQWSVITSEQGGTQQVGDRVVGGLGNIWGFPYASGLAGASWIRLATPVAAEHYREYVFQPQWRFNQDGNRHRMWVAVAFDDSTFNAGGSAVALPLPADTTRYLCLAGTQNPKASGTGENQTPWDQYFGPDTSGYVHWFIGDADEDFDFLFMTTRTIGAGIWRLFGQFRLTNLWASAQGEEDLDPYLYLCTGGNDNAQSNAGMFRVNNNTPTNPADYVAAINERVTSVQQSNVADAGYNGWYASWGYWASGLQPLVGRYFVCPVQPSSGSGSGYTNINAAFGKPSPEGRSAVLFNPLILRATTEVPANTGPSFIKGRIKNDLIALATRNDAIPIPEDFEGPVGSSTGRRISFGFFHFRWVEGQLFQV